MSMKQPELGKKILGLRRSKGLTQEELVEKCQVSVRTIQRIETGEVTPRSYTVKTILDALGSDIEDLNTEGTLTIARPGAFKAAWISGIVYFLLFLFEVPMDFTRFMAASGVPEDVLFQSLPTVDFSPVFYVAVKILAMVSFLLFLNGFLTMGRVVKNSLLRISSLLLMSAMSFVLLYDSISLFFTSIDSLIVQAGIAFVLGVLAILFGIAFVRLRSRFGYLGIAAGGIEIVSGILYVLLVPIGPILQLIAVVLEVIILYRFISSNGIDHGPLK